MYWHTYKRLTRHAEFFGGCDGWWWGVKRRLIFWQDQITFPQKITKTRLHYEWNTTETHLRSWFRFPKKSRIVKSSILTNGFKLIHPFLTTKRSKENAPAGRKQGMSTSCRKMLFLLSYALQPVEQCKQRRDEEQEFESSRVSWESSETGWLNIAAGETKKQRTNVPYVSSVPGHTGPGQKRYIARKSLASL